MIECDGERLSNYMRQSYKHDTSPSKEPMNRWINGIGGKPTEEVLEMMWNYARKLPTKCSTMKRGVVMGTNE